MHSFYRFPSVVLSVFCLSSCSLYGDYFSAAPDDPAQGKRYAAVADVADRQDHDALSPWGDTPWWHVFERPDLDRLIVSAYDGNQTVAQAVARLKQAQAVAKQTGSDRFPEVSATADAGKSWEESDAQRGTASAGVSLSWEIDFFNRIGAATEADRLLAEARAEDVESLKLFLSADIASAYFGAASARRRLALLNDQVTLDNDLLDLLELRLENGIGTSVDVLQQKSQLADSKTLIPLAEADLRVFENQLDVLVGEMPDGVDRVAADEDLRFVQTLPHVGVPSDLLLHRPDLRAQLRVLQAADADIRAAIADRLPRIMLDGSYLYSDAASYTGPLGTIVGNFVQPLLDWGKRRAAVTENKAIYEEELARFTQTYLEAVRDVENALYQERRQREYLARLEERRDILEETVSETDARYKQGIDDYLPVINALQELREVERRLITEQRALVDYRIDLYRAVGGNIDAQDVTIKKDATHEKTNG
ncbi:MAG: efflux transporter outer membrane subunit [Alphaproteobacteria bacterium]|nr:efflux transporter outer membrane subunit [Alphaproteobacteria bacterium]MDP7223509.1 efflux transporter outer membrane subunit [Alphaproteobacteria bacterium]